MERVKHDVYTWGAVLPAGKYLTSYTDNHNGDTVKVIKEWRMPYGDSCHLNSMMTCAFLGSSLLYPARHTYCDLYDTGVIDKQRLPQCLKDFEGGRNVLICAEEK